MLQPLVPGDLNLFDTPGLEEIITVGEGYIFVRTFFQECVFYILPVDMVYIFHDIPYIKVIASFTPVALNKSTQFFSQFFMNIVTWNGRLN